VSLLIKGGLVVDPSRRLEEPLDLLVEKGKIAALLPPGEITGEGRRVISAQGLVVAPGLVDMHVHLREPGEEYKETIVTGTQAAIRGGFTGVACMPNTRPVNDTAAVTRLILDQAAHAGYARVYPVGAVSVGSKGQTLSEYGDLKAAGVVALSDDGRPVSNAMLMRRAMEYARTFDLPIISHCEDLDLRGEGVMHEGAVSVKLGLKGIPGAAEEVMVYRDLTLAVLTRARVHFAHVSTAASVAIIRLARGMGLEVTAETAPHYFSLTEAAVEGYNTNAKVNPPLRTEMDVKAIKAALRDGTLDAVASDHAPHSSLDKEVEFNAAAFGLIGLETSLGLTLKLVHNGDLTLMQALERLSTGPALILGVPGGSLEEGAPGDLTLIDLHREWTVDVNTFASKSRNCPFHGWTLKGKAVMTIVGGKVVWEEEEE
jgi:dihydroorotase